MTVATSTGAQTPAETDMIDSYVVASMLGVTPHTVWVWSRTGQIPIAFRKGRILRFSRQAVEKWISENSK